MTDNNNHSTIDHSYSIKRACSTNLVDGRNAITTMFNERSPPLSESYRLIARLRCLHECMTMIDQLMPQSVCYSPFAIPYTINTRISKENNNNERQPGTIRLYTNTTDDIYIDYIPPINAILWISPDHHAHFGELRRIETVTMNDVDNQYRYVRLDGIQCDVSIMNTNNQQDSFDTNTHCRLFSWQDAVDLSYSFSPYHQLLRKHLVECDQSIVQSMRNRPADDWTIKHDESLIELIANNWNNDPIGDCGRTASYVESIVLSSSIDYQQVAIHALMDDNPDTYWESDASDTPQRTPHNVIISLKPNTIIEQVFILIDPNDESYVPQRVAVYGHPTASTMVERVLLQETPKIDIDTADAHNVCILTSNSETFDRLEIVISECKDDGVDCRIRGMRLKSKNEISRPPVDWRWFDGIDHGLLAYRPAEQLFYRAVLLTRLATLLDFTLPYLVPTTNRNDAQLLLKCRILFPLSRRRQAVIDSLLRATAEEWLMESPKIYIDRQAECPILEQIRNELLRYDQNSNSLTFRWTTQHEQWWECVFIGEGVIDQGGAFRDSLCDIADNLCPMIGNPKMHLFIRCPDDETQFIINQNCKQLNMFEFVGKLMGACVRTREYIVLPFASFVWKQILNNESLTWCDVKRIEPYLTGIIDQLDMMHDEQQFEQMLQLNHGMIWLNESIQLINWSQRTCAIESAKCALLSYGNEQISAIRRGLVSVISESVISLMTWQCLERVISGRVDIDFDDLKKSCHLEDFDETDRRIIFLWQTLKSFNVEERSRFLRFVSGRRRLPTRIYICGGKYEDAIDCLPESSTCSNTLFFPDYTSAAICEAKLRYAIEHCIAIDTDVAPWEA